MPITAFVNTSPLRPQNLNDKQLHSDTSVEADWHGHNHSYVPGLNALIDLFILWYKSQQGECEDIPHLQKYMDLVHSSLDNITPELRWRGGLSRPPRSN